MVNKSQTDEERPYRIQLRSLGLPTNKEVVGVGFMRKVRGLDHQNYDPPYYSLSFIISGEGTYRMGDEEYSLREGSVFQRFPGHLHDTEVLSEVWEECFLDFGPSLRSSLEMMGLCSIEHPCGQISVDPHRQLRFKDLFDLFEKTTIDESTRLVPPALALAETCLREMKQNGRKIISPMVQEAKSLMEVDVSRRIPLEKVCLERGWNYESFRKSFKAQTGFSPHQYAIRQRMDEARMRLMSQPSLSVTNLAMDLGYNNIYEFSRHFKQVVGVSPKIFRG
jgi:AraC-like DNA-binding protein/quercetin dioxygenase-like cupin family protein